MATAQRQRVLADLRERIRGLARGTVRRRPALPFGVAPLDAHLPEGGLARGCLHEVVGGGPDLAHGAAAALFTAGVLARLRGPVLWCLKARDLFAPALAGVGLHPDRVIYAETGRETDILAVAEEGLRHRGLAGVVAEIARLGLTSSRRLQLAAEPSGVTAIAIRRWRGQGDAALEPTAAVTRWRITALPSAPLASPGVGRPRWRLELLRCRGADPASWIVEACDAEGRLALAPDLADGPAAAQVQRSVAG